MNDKIQNHIPLNQNDTEEHQAHELATISTQIHRLCTFIIEDYRHSLKHGLRTEDSSYGQSYTLTEEGNE